MNEMIEGTRINIKRDGSFEAQVVMNGEVVWSQPNFRNKPQAQEEANRQLARLKQQR